MGIDSRMEGLNNPTSEACVGTVVSLAGEITEPPGSGLGIDFAIGGLNNLTSDKALGIVGNSASGITEPPGGRTMGVEFHEAGEAQ